MRKTDGMIARVLDREDVQKVELQKMENDMVQVFVDGKELGKFRHYHPKVNRYDEFQDYHRIPIQISAQSILMIHHFSDRVGELF